MTYDPEADALYLHVADEPDAETREVALNVMVDLTEAGELVGVEVLAVSGRPRANPIAVAFEILGGEGRTRAA